MSTPGSITGEKIVALPIAHPDDHLFDDTFPPHFPSLADAFVESLHRRSTDIKLPLQFYGLDSIIGEVAGQNVTIKADSFHQATAFGVDARGITEIATAHHQKLRDLGMTVVGHNFEVVSPEDDRFEVSQDFPAILTGSKLPFIPPYSLMAHQQAPPNAITLGGSNLKTTLLEIGSTSKSLKDTILDPLEAYFQWCEDDQQDYVLSHLGDLSNYLHHTLTGKIALSNISTSLGSIELGNLSARRRNLSFLLQSLKKQNIL